MAPSSYAICGRLNRLSDEDHRDYDLADAVVYLHEHLLQAKRHAGDVRTIRD